MKGKIPKILSMGLALVLVLSFSLVAAVPVAASPDVSDVRVELETYDDAALNVDYHIYFTPGADLAAGVDTITILFPVDTGNIANLAFGDVSVDADADAVHAGPTVLPAAGYLGVAGYRAEITTPVALTAGVEARVDILAKLTNPTAAGTAYKVELWTSQETTHVLSSAYTITAGISAELAAVDFTTTAPAPTNVGVPATWTIDITITTVLVEDWDTISIVFPEGTGLPAFIAPANVTVQDTTVHNAAPGAVTACTEAPMISGRTVTLKVPVGATGDDGLIAAADVFQIIFAVANVITNPILANDAAPNNNDLINTGHYIGKAYTSKDNEVIWDTTFPGVELVFDPIAASGLGFDPASAGGHSVVVNTASGNIDIWTIDLYGNRTSLPAGVTIDVDLSSSSATGTFYDTADGDNTFNDDEATVAAGGNTATFQYQDSAVGSYTITASYGSWSPVDWAMEVLTALKAELYDGDVLVGTYDNITAAIADALATNTIKVGPGTYREGALPALAQADLTLESTDGAATTIIDPNAAGNALTVTADGVTIKGFTIQNSLAAAGNILVDLNYAGAENAAKTVTIQDCTLDLTSTAADVADDGVVITAAVDGINIQNCDFIVEGTDDAVTTAAGGTTDVAIDTCTFTGSSGYGYVDGFGIGTTLSNCTFDGLDMGLDLDAAGCDVTVDSCTFINASAVTPAVGAIDVGTAPIAAPASLVIQGSTFQDNAGYSINVAAAAASNQIWVKFNSFLNNAEGMNCGGAPALNAIHNYWGDASGPSGVGAGIGDAISANVDYDPWFRAPVSAGAFADGAASLNAQAAVGMSITGADAAAADLAVARYTENPVETPEFTPIENGFFDAYVSAVGGVTQVGIKFYDAAITSDSTAYMWDAFEEVWKECTEQSAISGMVWVKTRPYDADYPRVPTIEDLAGTVFAISTVPAVTLQSIAASPSSVTLAVDETQQLTITATYSDASTANVTADSTYASDDEAVATVSTGGFITGVAEGSATVTATYTEDEITKTAEVSVTVSGVFDPMVYDADEDGAISKTEALTAVTDYFDSEITKAQALLVIVEYMG